MTTNESVTATGGWPAARRALVARYGCSNIARATGVKSTPYAGPVRRYTFRVEWSETAVEAAA